MLKVTLNLFFFIFFLPSLPKCRKTRVRTKCAFSCFLYNLLIINSHFGIICKNKTRFSSGVFHFSFDIFHFSSGVFHFSYDIFHFSSGVSYISFGVSYISFDDSYIFILPYLLFKCLCKERVWYLQFINGFD